MNPRVLQLRLRGDQTDFTRPDPVMKVSKIRRFRIWVNGLACGAQQHEDRGIEHVNDLAHKIQAREPVLTRRFSEIRPKISFFFRIVGDDKIRNHRQIGVPVIQERGFPIHQPDAVSVENYVFRLQVVVT